jgi:hypothetical protein
MGMSFKTEIIADKSGRWAGNDLCFATREEAETYVEDLEWRWLTVTATRVVEGDWPVTHRWDGSEKRARRIAD